MATAAVQPGRPKTSPVWDYFKYDVSLRKTVCQIDANGKHCEATFKGNFSTNLKAHLKSKHEEELLQKEKEITIKNDSALANSKKSQYNFKGQQTIIQVLQKAKKYISKIHNASTSLGN